MALDCNQYKTAVRLGKSAKTNPPDCQGTNYPAEQIIGIMTNHEVYELWTNHRLLGPDVLEFRIPDKSWGESRWAARGTQPYTDGSHLVPSEP